MKSPRVNWPCALNNAAKLTEGIEIQIALGNLLSIRSRKDFQYRLAQLRLHLRREILCLRRDWPGQRAEKYRRRAQTTLCQERHRYPDGNGAELTYGVSRSNLQLIGQAIISGARHRFLNNNDYN
jgi:hypothetical protein